MSYNVVRRTNTTASGTEESDTGFPSSKPSTSHRDSMGDDEEPLIAGDGSSMTYFELERGEEDKAWRKKGGSAAVRRRLWLVWQRVKTLVGKGDRLYKPRTSILSPTPGANIEKHPSNAVSNTKYRPLTFIFVVLYEQFRFFYNLYFLLIALSQFVRPLQVGFLFTYVAPLVFVLTVTISKEAYDDIIRWKRDREANSEKYQRLSPDGRRVQVSSAEIAVGDVIVLQTNERVPADMVMLRTTEKSGGSFIRTDQLDGETDWKLRRAIQLTQKLPNDNAIFHHSGSIYSDRPRKEIYEYLGTYYAHDDKGAQVSESLNLENTLWANTVVASGIVLGIVIYTGFETRSQMNAKSPVSKVGLLDLELNHLSKILFLLMVLMAFVMVAVKDFSGPWGIYLFRFGILFCSIIPISLRVNLDMGKTVYSHFIQTDKNIPNTIVRTSTIPEDLGRVEYLLTDKTGTLTQNDMIFKKLHLGAISFSRDSLEEVAKYMRSPTTAAARPSTSSSGARSGRNDSMVGSRNREAEIVHRIMFAIALCHNVTPTSQDGQRAYEASSPDEIALVKFAESVGLVLYDRDMTTITLQTPWGSRQTYEVLSIFPFTSETKRMGIIVRNTETGLITFYIKGADAVMATRVMYNDWLEEECDNMAREGLRTLVFAKRDLSQEAFERFNMRYNDAKTAIQNRAERVQEVVESLEVDLELIGLTGVEDKLQRDVKSCLETLRNAGIRIWMLTGDKMETATCVAISSRLVARNQTIVPFSITSKSEAGKLLSQFELKDGACMIIDGSSLAICLEHLPQRFADVACKAPAVVCCRCSPTQKSEVVKLLKQHTKKRTCAIGDGGNDVAMITEADVGLGIVGKEGKQASLAADFSITEFSFVTRLLLWHGRNSYKRSARMGQFVIHRGLIISIIQAVFSAIFYFVAIPIYNGWLMVGYTTYYTMAPVFALVLDEDISDEKVMVYPELYRDLQKGRSLSHKTFFTWVALSVYQGSIIMILGIILFSDSFINIVGITFTSLILSELFNAAMDVHKWHRYMVISQLSSLVVYAASMVLLRTYFDITFILTWGFWWKVVVITAASCAPPYIIQYIRRKVDPPTYTKLT